MHCYHEQYHLHIGMRNVKTALTATLCALIYFLIHRNPTFACIGVIFGMGSDMVNSKLNGGNRLLGTLFGGMIGILLFRLYICLYPKGGLHYALLPFLFVGVIILVIVCLFFHWPGAIQPGGVVLCILLFNTPVDTYIQYSLDRIFDTALGVILAIDVNALFPRDRVIRILNRLGIHKLDEENAIQ